MEENKKDKFPHIAAKFRKKDGKYGSICRSVDLEKMDHDADLKLKHVSHIEREVQRLFELRHHPGASASSQDAATTQQADQATAAEDDDSSSAMDVEEDVADPE